MHNPSSLMSECAVMFNHKSDSRLGYEKKKKRLAGDSLPIWGYCFHRKMPFSTRSTRGLKYTLESDASYPPKVKSKNIYQSLLLPSNHTSFKRQTLASEVEGEKSTKIKSDVNC